MLERHRASMTRFAPFRGAPGGGGKLAGTSREYRQLLIDARRRQLQLTQETVRRVDQVLDRAAAELARTYRALPSVGDSPRRSYIRARMAELRKLSDNLHREYGQVLGAGMATHAQAGVDRERHVAHLVGAVPSGPGLQPTLHRFYQVGGRRLRVDFSPVALGAIESVLKRVYPDGLKLSDRLWRLDELSRTGVEDRLLNALATGQSARDLAKDLKQFLAGEGEANARYNAMRLARTEINTAYREASIQAAIDPETGKLQPWIRGLRWTVSASHDHRDVCDLYAADDSAGLGPGVYLPDGVPLGHPHCMCYLADDLVAAPEVSISRVQPVPGEVPDADVERHARAGDPVAKRELQRRSGL